MKKYALLIVLFSGISIGVHAQVTKYGISAGFTYPNFSYQSNLASNISEVSNHSFPPMSLNASVEWPLFHRFSMQTEIGYLYSSFKVHFLRQNYSYPSMVDFPQYYNGFTLYKFQNVQIGTYFKYRLLKKSNIYFQAGPRLTFLLHADKQQKLSYRDTGRLISDQNESLYSAMHRFNLSFNGGIGYEFNFIKNISPYIEAIYSFGITNLAKPNHSQQFYPFTFPKNWRQHSVELKFGVIL